MAFGQTHADSAAQPSKARIALVGDAERFTIGQDGYCGQRTEIENPSSVSFEVPGGKETWFYIHTKFRSPIGTYTCEGDFAFKPDSGLLHIIRYTMEGDRCNLELFKSLPGKDPQRASFVQGPRRSCLKQ
jgi:hypothetical protein